MPLINKEARNTYERERKRKKRLSLGLPARGKHIRPIRTKEQVDISKKKSLQRLRKWRMEYTDLNIEKKLLWSARRRAKQKGIDCYITETDIIVPTHCPILGMLLVPSQRRGSIRRDIATLDRVDPTKGYTKDNIEVISWLANTMKNNATPEQLITFSKEMLKRYDI